MQPFKQPNSNPLKLTCLTNGQKDVNKKFQSELAARPGWKANNDSSCMKYHLPSKSLKKLQQVPRPTHLRPLSLHNNPSLAIRSMSKKTSKPTSDTKQRQHQIINAVLSNPPLPFSSKLYELSSATRRFFVRGACFFSLE